MDTAQLVGFVAGFLTTIAFIPQVLKIWKSKSAKDVSLRTYSALTIGLSLWLIYGVLLVEPAIILWNAVTLVLATAILLMKIRYG